MRASPRSSSSPARVYQSADHPEHARLVFTTQLHHQLQTLARNRELCALPGAPSSQAPACSAEVNGWEVEKKMMLLRELRPVLEMPHFVYADCGSHGAGAAAERASPTAFFSMDAYFNKTLPLATGQHSLLDLWDYLMDMCDHVPVRNRCRALYLHIAVCICRRVEFISGYVIDGEPVNVDENVQDRYYQLLGRCITLATKKLVQSRILLEENALFMGHVYTTVCFRFPSRSSKVFDALIDCTAVLEDQTRGLPLERGRSQSEPLSFHNQSESMTREPELRQQSRSPRDVRRDWNFLAGYERRISGVRPDERITSVLAGFSQYKLARGRGTDKLQPLQGGGTAHVANGGLFRRRTVETTLRKALEAEFAPGEGITNEEMDFIRNLPILHSFGATERQTLRQEPFRDDLDDGIELFLDRLRRPDRDDLLVLYFIGAFLSDVSYWCRAAFNVPHGLVLWQCIPGYFCLVRAYTAVFKRMCQRRPRMTVTSNATAGNVLAILEGYHSDMWASYWTQREINTVIDPLSEVLKNHRLVDTFVEIVLEGTNILDPMSVNYSLSILQRVLDVGATFSSSNKTRTAVISSMKMRGTLNDSFDDAYFCTAMRKALLSSHVQILLKALTFLYNCLDLLPSRGRRRIISELVIRENFFRLFLHWNDEIRKIYSYIIVFKSPFFESGSSGGVSMLSPTSPSFGYWSHLSDIAQSMLSSSTAEIKEEQRRTAAAIGLSNLIAWNVHDSVHRHHNSRRDSLFRASLDDDDISVDLLVASKVDASLKMLADQVGKKMNSPAQYFPVEQEAYAERALSQYVGVLWEYYASAFERPSSTPTAPKLEFTISSLLSVE